MKVNWDLSHLYNNINEWQYDYDLMISNVEKLNVLVLNSLDNEEEFLQYLNLLMDTNKLVERLYCFPKRHVDLDSTSDTYKTMMEKVLSVYSEIKNIENKFENLLINNKDKVLNYLGCEKLKKYTRYINLILRRERYIIVDEDSVKKCSNYSKELQSLKDEYRFLANEKIRFKKVNINNEEVEVNRNTYSSLMSNECQENRKKVFDLYTNSFIEIKDEMFSIYKEKLVKDINIARLEGYKSLLHKKLFELELDEEIVSNLINTINANLSIMHRYVELKKKLTGINDYHFYDTSLSICDVPKMEYEFEDALTIIKKALSIFGEDYVDFIDRMFIEGWVDVYPKQNKRSMSFTCISYVGVPYTLLNYNKSIDSVRTCVHELGHGYHVNASKASNDFVNFEFSYFLTEIASKVNELILSDYMINTSKSLEEKKYILNSLIGNLGNSLFNQVMLTEFEHSLIAEFSKGDVSLEQINNLYMELMKKYNGDSIIYDDNIRYGWLKIPHFVMQDTYYVYQYAIGMSIATDIARRILNREEGFVEKYKKFLTLGNSVSIKEALSVIGINLESEDYINGAIKVLSKKIDEMENLFN